MRGRVVSEASDEQRAALSSDPTIRNAVSSGHFYFYSAVSAFCSSLCSRFLLFPESSAAEESGEMHAFRCCRRQEHELLPLPPSVRVSPLINSLLRMSIRDIKSPLRKTPDILTGKMKKLFFLRGWTGPCFDRSRANTVPITLRYPVPYALLETCSISSELSVRYHSVAIFFLRHTLNL